MYTTTTTTAQAQRGGGIGHRSVELQEAAFSALILTLTLTLTIAASSYRQLLGYVATYCLRLYYGRTYYGFTGSCSAMWPSSSSSLASVSPTGCTPR